MSFTLPITHNIEQINLQRGIFIFIHRAGKIPPHIGLVVNGTIFEISTVGPGSTHKAIDMLKTAMKRKTELLFIELSKPNIAVEVLEIKAIHLVNKYFKVTEKISCLFPIREFIQETYVIPALKSEFIFELLPLLYQYKLIKATYQVNLSTQLIEGKFKLQTYTHEEVKKCVAATQRKSKINFGV